LSLGALLAVLGALFAGVVAGSAARNRPRKPGPIPTPSCAQGPLAKAPLPGEDVYRAGPLTLAVVDYSHIADLGRRQLAHPLGSKAIAVVTGGRSVVLAVARGSRDRFSLQFSAERGDGSPMARLADGRPAVRFPGCGRGPHRFGGGILFADPGCVHLRVQPADSWPIPMVIPIGSRFRGCLAAGPAVRIGQ
jgi:hypothetical protein